ncbi:MAG: helix-turn-helix domain-containing protein [Polyangiaceae bacterium]
MGERWTLLVVRELLCGDYRFSELMNGLPLISRSLLSQRLKTLEEAGLIERKQTGSAVVYALTDSGRDLAPVVMGLGAWAKRWVRRKLTSEELDPVLLMWDVRRRLDIERLPASRTIVMFWFRDLPAKRCRYWLSAERPNVDLCLTNPGFEVALSVETTLRTMVDVWMGGREANDAIQSGAIELKGTARLTKAFPNWLLLSTFAHLEA